jgi:hypothetical protein
LDAKDIRWRKCHPMLTSPLPSCACSRAADDQGRTRGRPTLAITRQHAARTRAASHWPGRTRGAPHRAHRHPALQHAACACGRCRQTRPGRVPLGRWRRTGAWGAAKRTAAQTRGARSLHGPRSVGRFSLYCSGSAPSSAGSMT